MKNEVKKEYEKNRIYLFISYILNKLTRLI